MSSQVSIKVEVIEGRNLLAADAGGTSDPYVRIKLNGDQRVAKTKVIKKTLTPYWNETYVIPLVKKDPSVFLKFECWDEDPFTDDPLGYFVVYLNDLQPNVPREQWYKLDHVATGELRIVLTLLVEGGAPASGPTPTPTTALAESAKPGGIVKTALGEVRLQGWLFKYNQRRKLRRRRYFVLAGGTLSWTAKANDMTPLNKIPVGSVKVMPTGSTDLLLSGTKNGKPKDWVLSGQTPEEAKMWVEALTDSQKTSKWMTKDKKRSWYLLQHSVLYWFHKEVDPAADFKKDIQGAIKLYLYSVKEVPGSEPVFEVHDYLPSAYPEEEKTQGEKKGSVSIINMNSSSGKRAATFDDLNEVTCSLSKRTFTFRANTKEELRDWLESMHEDVRKHKKRNDAGTEFLGWLKPKGGKKSFCVLSRGRFSWFKSAEDISEGEKGSVVLDGCAVRKDANNQLTIYSPSNPTLVHTFNYDKETEIDAWVGALQVAIAAIAQKTSDLTDEIRAQAVNTKARVDMSGWLILKGKRKYFGKLKGDMLLLYENEPQESLARTRIEAKLADSIRLKDAHITRQDFTFTIRTPDGQTFVLGAQSKRDIAEWIVSIQAALQQLRGIAYAQAKGTAIDPKLMAAYKADLSRQGYVTREKKKRMLELAVGRLSELDAQLKPKLIIPLENASITQVDSTSFLVRTSAYSNLYTCNKDDTTEWVKNISFYIIKANAAAVSSSELDKSGWLIVQGKPCWCGLKNGKFSWFSSEQRANYAFPDKETASVVDNKFGAVPNPSKKKSKNFVFTINTQPKPIEIRGDCEVTTTDWLNAFQTAVDNEAKKRNAAFTNANAAPVFGVPLTAVLATDKRLKRIEESDILPYVITQCLAFLEKDEAMGTKDLWKANTAFSKAREWANQLNAGQKINLTSAAPRDIAGLLKYFLKQLPEPLVTLEVQPVILDHRMESTIIAAALRRLPAPNFALLTRLVKHLDQLTVFLLEAEDANAVDLAMAFAPLLFRIESAPKQGGDSDADSTSSETEEMEQMMAVLATGTMIANYYEVFEGKPPTLAQALGVAKEDTKIVQEAMKSDNLDQLLAQFKSGDTQGLTEQQVLAITTKLKKKENFVGGATVKRVDDALDDLDDLMGDLNASRFGRESMLRKKRISNAPEVLSAVPTPADKERFSGGLTVKRVDDAVTDLDDLMGDMNKSRARRQSALAASTRPKILSASMQVDSMLASVKQDNAPKITDDELAYLMKDSIMQRKQDRGKPKPAGKFAGGTTVKRVDEAVSDLDDLLDDMTTSRVRRTHQQDELLEEASIAIKKNKADARSMMTALKASVRPGSSAASMGSVSMAFADYEASKPTAKPDTSSSSMGTVSMAFADYDASKPQGRPPARTEPTKPSLSVAPPRPKTSAPSMSSSFSHPSPSSPAADTQSTASLHATIAAPQRPATLGHHSTVSTLPTVHEPTPPMQHSASYHHPAPPSNLGSSYYAPDLGASYYAPSAAPAAQPPANLAQSYHAPSPQSLAPPANLGHSYHAPSPQAAVQAPPANLAQSYHAPLPTAAPANLGGSYHAPAQPAANPPLMGTTSFYAPELGANYTGQPANLAQSYAAPAPQGYAGGSNLAHSYAAPASNYHSPAASLAQSYAAPAQPTNLAGSYYAPAAPAPGYDQYQQQQQGYPQGGYPPQGGYDPNQQYHQQGYQQYPQGGY